MRFLLFLWGPSLPINKVLSFLGDLFIDGKVIPRPQYRFSERQQPNRNRPRPRYDRRRETMQVERREPMQSRTGNMREPVHQPTSTSNQSVVQGGPGGISMNRRDV